MGQRVAQKVLLIGWDAADWQIIHPLLDAGQMPALADVINRGVMGNLTSVQPLDVYPLWTSAMTGMRPDRHGILTFAEPDPVAGGMRASGSTSRRAAALWSMLGARGLRTHAVNWPASHPAEPVNGVAISEFFAPMIGARDDADGVKPGTIFPVALTESLAALRVHPRDLSGEHLVPFVPRAVEVDQKSDKRLAMIAEHLATCTTVHAAATWLLEHEPWDFLAVRYDALQAISREFLAYLPPRQPRISERDFELYRDVVAGFYRYFDMMLERLIRIAGPDATVIVVSQHGVRTGDLRPSPRLGIGDKIGAWRRGTGMLAMAGPGIRSDALVHGGSILDLVPTVLTLFGLPTGEDMEGRPLLAAFAEAPRIARIASWDGECARPPARPVAAANDLKAIDDALAELVELGYADAPGKAELALMRATDQHRTYNLARNYMDARKFDDAASLLEGLLREKPQARVVALALAQCRYRLGQLDACKRLVQEVLDCEIDGPVVRLLEANLALMDGRIDDALAHLDQAEASGGLWPEVHCQRGRAFLQMERFDDAQRAFASALALDGDYVRAHLGLAMAHLRAKRFEDAAAAALECIGRDFNYAQAHYVLGEALASMGRASEAVHTFNLYLQMRPNAPSAHHWLATLYEKALGDPVQSAVHRAQAWHLEQSGAREDLQHA